MATNPGGVGEHLDDGLGRIPSGLALVAEPPVRSVADRGGQHCARSGGGCAGNSWLVCRRAAELRGAQLVIVTVIAGGLGVVMGPF